MTSGRPLLYLTDADVAALELEVHSVRIAVKEAFRRYSAGELRCEPKTSIAIKPGHAFQSLAAVDTQRNFAALKWVGMIPPGGAANVNINASLVLSDVQTGQLCCLMDARRATALRTAGMSAVAADYLARKESACIGFVGAGVQAESHLLAFAEILPSLRTVYVNSIPSPSAQRFAAKGRELGFDAAVGTAEQVLRHSDVVVTTVPLVPDFEPFIEASWVRPGTFVVAVDLGRSWKHAGLSDIDVTVVDEEAMKHYAKPGNFVPPLGYAHATLVDLVSGRHQGRTSEQERIILFSSGSAIADAAIAILIYERALAKGAGLRLPH
jgi:alanine dehydrogenase